MRLTADNFPLDVRIITMAYVCEGCGQERAPGQLVAFCRNREASITDDDFAGLYCFCMGCCQVAASRQFAEYEAAVAARGAAG